MKKIFLFLILGIFVLTSALSFVSAGNYVFENTSGTELMKIYGTNGNVTILGDLKANGMFYGDGGGLTNISASALNVSNINFWNKSGTSLYYNDGNVGIGTTFPSYKLDVQGTTAQIAVNSTTSTNPALFRGHNGGGDFYVGRDSSAGGQLATSSSAYAFVINSQGAYPMQFAVNNNIGLTMLNGGNVGIGTTSPSGKLHVYDNSTSVRPFILEQAGTGDSALQFGITGVTNWIVGSDNSDSDKFKIANSNTLGTTDRMVIDSSGYVGIGTSSPQNTLNVVGSTGKIANFSSTTAGLPSLIIGASDGTWDTWGVPIKATGGSSASALRLQSDTGSIQLYDGASAYALNIYHGSSNNIRLSANSSVNSYINAGNFGINTTTPQNTLNVVGNANVTGLIYGNGSQLTGIKGSQITNDYNWVNATSVNSSFVPYTGSNANVVLGAYNFSVDNTDLFVNANTGYVGIGTTAPTRQLQINSSADTGIKLTRSGANPSTWEIMAGYQNANGDFWIGNTAPKLLIDSNGNLGIGTIVPDRKLTVNGTGNTEIGIKGTSGAGLNLHGGYKNWTISTDSNYGKLHFAIGGLTDSMTIHDSNVGIGTSTPQQMLHVAGNVIFNGTLNMDAHQINNLANGTSATDAVTLSQLQGINISLNNLNSTGLIRDWNVNITAANSSMKTYVDSSFLRKDGDNGTGQYNFNGGWTNGGMSIRNGDVYAQTVYVYNISSLQVANLNINGTLLPQIGYDNQFDVGSPTLRWNDGYFGGDLYVNGSILAGNQTMVGGVGSANRAAFWTDADSLSYDDNFTWDNTNKRLGIGTSSPGFPLVVSKNSTTPIIQASGSLGAGNEIGFGVDNSGGYIQQSGATTPFRFYVNGASRFGIGYNGGTWFGSSYNGANPADGTVLVAGNVGIGTTSPAYKLDVNTTGITIANFRSSNSTVSAVRLVGTGGTGGIGIQNNDLLFWSDYDNDVRSMTIADGGNVGIGTYTPGYKLDVSGPVNASAYFINGTQLTASSLGGINGSGTSGYIARFNATSSINNSAIYENGGNIGIGTVIPGAKLHVDAGAGIGVRINSSGSYSYNSLEINNTRGDYQGIRYFASGGSGDYLANNIYFQDARPSTSGSVGSFFTIARTGALTKGNILQVGATSSANDLVVSNLSYVGIGTASPSYKLDVNGPVNASAYFINGTQLTASSIGGLNGSGSVGNISYWNTTGSLTSSPIYYNTTNGNVGIGTTSPGSKLEVSVGSGGRVSLIGSGTGNVGYKINNTGGDFIIGREQSTSGGLLTGDTGYAAVLAASGAYPIQFGVNDAVAMTILNGGNVGIGTVSPNNTLHVIGTGNISSNLTVDGGTLFANANTNYVGINSLTPTANLYVNGNFSIVNSTGTQGLYQSALGRVGIGSSNPTNKLYITETGPDNNYDSVYVNYQSTSGVNDIYSSAGRFRNTLGGGANSYSTGIIGEAIKTGDYGFTATGVQGRGIYNSSSTYTHLSGLSLSGVNADVSVLGVGNNTIPTGISLQTTATVASGNNLTSYYGVYVTAPSGSGIIANKYALVTEANAGNVGIGTTSPSYKLDVNGPVNASAYFINGTQLTASSIGGLNGSGSVGNISYWNTTGSLTSSPIYYNTTNGNVGIGTTSPQDTLHINKSGTNPLSTLSVSNDMGTAKFGTQSGYTRLLANNDVLYAGQLSASYFYDSTGTTMAITGGKIGIGTISPVGKLNVNGTGVTFNVSNQTNTHLMVSGSTGNVGIGITNPLVALDVLSTANNVPTPLANVPGASTSAIFGNTGTNGIVAIGQDNSGNGWIQGRSRLAGQAANPLLLNPLGGNVGVGTSSPGAKLEVLQGMSNYSTAFTSPHLKLMTSDTVDNTGFVGITYASSTTANYGWSVGGVRSNSGQSDFVWKFHSSSDSGTEWMRIKNTGYIGMNTTTPQNTLNVVGTFNTTGASYLLNSKCAAGQVLTTDATTGLVSCVAASGLSGVINGSGTSGYIARFNGTSTINNSALFESGGNVGIGTTGPLNKLDVNGSLGLLGGTSEIRFYNSTGSIKQYVWLNGNSLGLGVGSAGNSVYIDSTGNMGVGTTNPTYKLDVAGSFRANTSGWFKGSVDGSNADALYLGRYSDSDAAMFTISTDDATGDKFVISSGRYTPTYNFKGGGGAANGIVLEYDYSAGSYVHVYNRANVETVRLNSNGSSYFTGGNVGINTSSPTSILHVYGRSYTASSLSEIYSSPIFRVQTQGAASNSSIFIANVGSGVEALQGASGTSSTSALVLNPYGGNVGVGMINPQNTLNVNGTLNITNTTNSPILITTAVGNIGIGTTNPLELLHVNKSANDARIRIETEAAGAYLTMDSASDGYFGIDYNSAGTSKWFLGSYGVADFTLKRGSASAGTTYLFVDDATGNIGIGNSGPAYKLDVNGPVNASAYFINGTQLTASSIGGLNGSGSVGNVSYWNSTGSLSSSPIYYNTTNGNVGIGTTSPGELLHVSGSSHTYAKTQTSGASHVAGFYSATPTTELDFISYGGYSNTVFGVSTIGYNALLGNTGGLIVGTSGATNLIFGTNNTERIRILSGGNVGIGTTAPTSLLDVRAADAVTGVLTIGGGKVTVTTVGEINSQLDFKSNDASVASANNIGGRIASVTEYNNGAETGLAFSTYKQARGTLAEAVRIDNNGNVGIGTITPVGKLNINGTGVTFNVSNQTNTHLMVSGSTGNVGIGTSSPNYAISYGGTGDINIKRLAFWESGGQYFYGIGGVDPDLAVSSNEGLGLWGGTENNIPWNGTSGVMPNLFIKRNSGNVGIGTASPQGKLNINGTDITFNISNQTNTQFIINSTNGRVGIGTITPTKTLDVIGTFKSDAFWTDTAGVTYWGSTPTASGVLTWDTLYASVYATANKTLRLGANATEGTIVINGTNVGIGTATPGYKLDVVGQVYASTGFLLPNNQDLGAKRAGGTAQSLILLDTGDDIQIGSSALANDINLRSSSGSLLTILTAGNVGIGTTSPSSKLTINTTSASSTGGIRLLGYTYPADISYWNGGEFAMQYNGSYKNVLSNNGSSYLMGGNVGINTSSPTQTLNVKGEINVTQANNDVSMYFENGILVVSG